LHLQIHHTPFHIVVLAYAASAELEAMLSSRVLTCSTHFRKAMEVIGICKAFGETLVVSLVHYMQP